MSNKVFHIIPYEKFTFDYITQINRCFSPQNHLFCIHGKKPSNEIKTVENLGGNIQLYNRIRLQEAVGIVHEAQKYDKIIIHSLFMPPVLFSVISLNITRMSDKVFWNIWGADLYDTYWSKNKNFAHMVREALRKHFIRHLRAVGYIYSDFDCLKKWYKTEAKFFPASYSYEFFDVEQSSCGDTNILIGNSATRSCQHKEAIDMIKHSGINRANIWCVLSYPNDKEYIDEVVNYGTKILGDSFHPLVDYMPYDQYMKMLSGIDIAIFNNNRQQALGNIAGLLFYGKCVFVNPKNGCLDYFQKMGVEIYSTDDFDVLSKYKPTSEMKKHNQEVIRSFFSDEKFSERWNIIFESKY